ncbi:MAG: PAS domain S-box protein [Deltaproteobacteria bacterium]|nr:PAS domain S-box protein [Deltaproteobacteria bacterium]
MKILIVDDEDNSRIYLERALKAQGYGVESAATGTQALALARHSPPDMIISDILMPEMDGFMLCRQIKEDERLKTIPFVFYSATYCERDDEKLAMSLGASRFIVKPMELQDFLLIILKILEEDKGKTLAVPESTKIEPEELDQMHLEALTRKLLKKINQLEESRKDIEESEKKYRAYIDESPTAIFVTDGQGRFLEVNQAAGRLTGYSPEELLNMTILDLLASGEGDRLRSRFTDLQKDGRIMEEVELRRRDESSIFVILNAAGLTNDRYIAFCQDITERKRAEEIIKASLKEKEVMLREIHHRVKNNLQIIIGLLNLQSEYSKDAHVTSHLGECRNRIKTMASVHEKLCRAPNLAGIDLKDYIDDLVGTAFISYGTIPGKVRIETKVEAINLGIDTAVPFGLILNELVSNCLKHAFPGDRKGTISISLRVLDVDQLELIVADDGVGLPAGLDLSRTLSLGWELITGLTRQIKGKLEILKDTGVAVRITLNKPF